MTTTQTVGVLVHDLTLSQAEDVANIRMVTNILPAFGRGAYYTSGPREVDERAARAAALELWANQELEWREAIELIRTRIGQVSRERLAPTPLLSDVAFRSACRLVGVDEGPPVRLYDENGLGIIFLDDFNQNMDHANLYIVLFHVRMP